MGHIVAALVGEVDYPRRSLLAMCRNITTLRGLEPAATPEEIEAAARQYVRKVSGVQSGSRLTDEAFERAVRRVRDATAELLGELPARRQPPPTLPPLRRLATRSVAGKSGERFGDPGGPDPAEPTSTGRSAPGRS
jgi:hypothetical protein